MRAAVLTAFGSPLQIGSVSRPEAAEGHVLVRIKASAVNPLDLKICKGQAAHARHSPPAILGIDVAGVVESVGAGVAGFAPGDEVYGMTGGVGGLQGSLAEFVAADARLLAPKPKTLDMRQAAALPLIFITASEGLVDRAHVRGGQKVLVHGGAGGVGHIAVQLARAFDAEVFATGSVKDKAYIEGIGASFIDYKETPVEAYVAAHTAARGFDLVYDTVGGAVLDASFNAVARFGHVVSALGWGTHALAPLSFRAASYSGVFTLLPILTGEGRAHHGDILREATRLVEAGKIVPRLDPRRFNLDTIMQAHAALESGAATGKIVLDIAT
ncbi:MAG: zinc-dependent alcohol dehydrogenase family protein [Bradyrhizobium sp.]|uniref:zinc-dependent alcohol dehydrogenase family protein n=1 Tax=Bradyrhizobium sp. TaxID=376 RepID=UPI001D8CDDDA|nr:zinc-dependent alcohol dehydrogenase family protein [Bradyrhizobium sp.]MBV9559572.1 zinc-dependent alcohol dehydrogenase family protein [Bradyrhizobium sp.]